MLKALKSHSKPDFSFEKRVKTSGFWPCAGVDEAGRGPLAGPVVAAAVILDPENIPEGLDDSKRLNAANRAALSDLILESSLAICSASVSAETIDATDIRKATLTAMVRTVAGLFIEPRYALIDGRDVPDGLACPAEAVIKGDQRSQSIAAASIVAKVLRDRMMERTAIQHPAFGFDSHAGYGTAGHRAAIAEHGGVERLHRISFAPLKNMSGK